MRCTWAGLPVAFLALGIGNTIREAKKDVDEAIQLWLEETMKAGWPIPKPEQKSVKRFESSFSLYPLDPETSLPPRWL
jgi:hypothetical protein